MPQIPKHRKVKRATVLIKKSQCLRSYLKTKSYKPLCEKLKSNNYSLAKALSKEKHESQLLFSQNVALVAEVQDLGSACSKRDAVISNILKNAKEMLKMIVTMTGYLTNTISTCQEFVASPVTNLRMSSNSTGRGDTSRRLSTKSPTRGVVKPMVSGHTITKPTINLSRVNMQHINNSSNLSIIQEVTTPPGNQELNRSRTTGHITMRQRGNEDGRVYRMPERLNVASPRHSDESERRLSKRSNNRSGRMSGSISKSRKLSSGNNSRNSIEHLEHIGSPTVKLNDVSKLLQNSQSINIRMLTENRNNSGNDTFENNDSVNQEDFEISIELPAESSPSNISKNHDNKIIVNENEEVDNELDSTPKIQENLSRTENTVDTDDPLEGPSWLFNNSLSVPLSEYKTHTFNSFEDKDKKTDEANVSNNDSKNMSITAAELSDVSANEQSVEETSSLSTANRRDEHLCILRKNKQTNSEDEDEVVQRNLNNDTFYDISTSNDSTVVNEDECKTESETAMKFSNFITQRRGCFGIEEEEDDFTLMYARPNNMHFDINDLKLPVLEESALKPIVPVEVEPEVTTTLKQISQICPLPSVSNNSLDESTFNQSTVKLPLVNHNDDKDLTPHKNKFEVLHRKKKAKNVASRESSEFIEGTPVMDRKSNRKKKDKPVNKDPSTVLVVLQKLNESDVKSRTPSPEVATSQDSVKSLSSYSKAEHSSDSENSNTSSSSMFALNRPRRKRAPTVLQEPSLRTKLRRN